MAETEVLPSRERPSEPIPVTFYKVGGTWDMVNRGGVLVGTGNLDNEEIGRLELDISDEVRRAHRRYSLEGFSLDVSLTELNRLREKRLAELLYQRMRGTQPVGDVGEHFGSWAQDEQTGLKIGDFIKGPFIPIYSGDSSYFRASLSAPVVAVLLEQLLKDPKKPILGGMGTDTADLAFLPLMDALIYDTPLPPVIFTGANYSHNEPNSDAPKNFVDLGRATHLDLTMLHQSANAEEVKEFLKSGERPFEQDSDFFAWMYENQRLASGAFWAFHDYVYPASDFVKLDPQETRLIEGQSTFFSPHQNSIRKLMEEALWANLLKTDWQHCNLPRKGHVLYSISMEKLFDAMNQVITIDLTDQNPLHQQIEILQDPAYKAIVIPGHGLGNAPNPLTYSAFFAEISRDKLVIVTSRHTVGGTSARYGASMLSHQMPMLAEKWPYLVDGYKANKTAARALAVRAILEGFNVYQTQFLFDNYCYTRNLLP